MLYGECIGGEMMAPAKIQLRKIEGCCSNSREMLVFLTQVESSWLFCYPLLILFVQFITLPFLPGL